MDWIKGLQHAIDYMEEHITEPNCEMDIEDYPDGDTTSEKYKSYIWVAVKKK